jgi:hypothetical protein
MTNAECSGLLLQLSGSHLTASPSLAAAARWAVTTKSPSFSCFAAPPEQALFFRVTLKYIGTQGGNDLYRAVYQNAPVTYAIRLSPSGKISLLLLQPAFPWE